MKEQHFPDLICCHVSTKQSFSGSVEATKIVTARVVQNGN